MQCPKPKTRLRSCSAVPSGRTRWHRMYQCVDARQGGCGRSRRESHPIPTRTLQPILILSFPQPNPYCAAHPTLSSFTHASNPPDTTTSQPQPPSLTHELIDVLTRLPIPEPHKSLFARRESALPSQTCPMPCNDTSAHASVSWHHQLPQTPCAAHAPLDHSPSTSRIKLATLNEVENPIRIHPKTREGCFCGLTP